MRKRQANLKVVPLLSGKSKRHPAQLESSQQKCVSLQPITTTKALPQPTANSSRFIPSLSVKTYQELLQQRLSDRLKSLEAQAQRINQLSSELDAAILELKDISTQINAELRAINKKAEICEYKARAVPYMKQKQDGSLVLTTRPIDLYKAEREAALLAQKLRRRTRRKRSDALGKF